MKFKSDLARLRYTGQQSPTRELEMDSCGYYTDVPKPIGVHRENGFSSHHFILILQGKVSYDCNDTKKTANRGSLLYFAPHAPQFYYYHPAPNSCYYWLHFNGTRIDSYLEQFPFKTGCYTPKSLFPYRQYIDKIIAANHSQRPGHDDYVNALLQLLLVELGQELFWQNTEGRSKQIAQEIAERIRRAPELPFSITQFAKESNRNENHLIRSFTKEYGCSPQSFRKRLLMEKATQLLASTDLNVSEIAYLLQFSDPLYFSRAFKKEIGISPSEYRKKRI